MDSALRLSAFFALAAVAAPRAHAFDPSRYDAATLRSLAELGQIVLVEEDTAGKVTMVTGGAVVDAPPDRVWATITDYTAYPEWMPDVTATEIVSDSGGRKDVHYTLNFKFSVITKTIEYTLRNEEEVPGRKISWSIVEGDFTKADGGWNLVPLDKGSKTLAFYSTYTDLDSMGWIVRGLIKEQPTMEISILASTALTVTKALSTKLDSAP